jgi:hypothetical protein
VFDVLYLYDEIDLFFFVVCSELSIPTLSSIVKRDEEKLNLFRTLKSKQIKIEENAIQRAHLADEKPTPECKPAE